MRWRETPSRRARSDCETPSATRRSRRSMPVERPLVPIAFAVAMRPSWAAQGSGQGVLFASVSSPTMRRHAVMMAASRSRSRCRSAWSRSAARRSRAAASGSAPGAPHSSSQRITTRAASLCPAPERAAPPGTRRPRRRRARTAAARPVRARLAAARPGSGPLQVTNGTRIPGAQPRLVVRRHDASPPSARSIASAASRRNSGTTAA